MTNHDNENFELQSDKTLDPTETGTEAAVPAAEAEKNTELTRMKFPNAADIPFVTDSTLDTDEPPTHLDEIDSEEYSELEFSLPEEDTHSFKKARRRKKRKKRILLVVFIVICSLILLTIAAIFILQSVGKSQILNYKGVKITLPDTIKEQLDVSQEDDGKTIKYNGATYRLNENITTVLCMGIDSYETDAEGFGGNGQSDANVLLAIDTQSGKTTAIPISRDTVVENNVYSDAGMLLETRREQLCLAYANGDGKKKSCENMKLSVSNLFYGMPIHSYMAINLDCIPILNDKVGGITVTSNETYSAYGYSFIDGQKINLKTKDQVEAFVRWRDTSRLESNTQRMARQKIYLKAFSSAAIKKTKSNITFPLSLYGAIGGENRNDLNAAKITYLTTSVIRGRSNASLNFKSIKGEVIKGQNGLAEFHADDKALFELILDVFYKKA